MKRIPTGGTMGTGDPRPSFPYKDGIHEKGQGVAPPRSRGCDNVEAAESRFYVFSELRFSPETILGPGLAGLGWAMAHHSFREGGFFFLCGTAALGCEADRPQSAESNAAHGFPGGTTLFGVLADATAPGSGRVRPTRGGCATSATPQSFTPSYTRHSRVRGGDGLGGVNGCRYSGITLGPTRRCRVPWDCACWPWRRRG